MAEAKSNYFKGVIGKRIEVIRHREWKGIKGIFEWSKIIKEEIISEKLEVHILAPGVDKIDELFLNGNKITLKLKNL